jgi:hypothetical protein
MKGIMFNEKYGLESAVLNGTKTRTWRSDKKPRYEVGEVVAIKQCYCKVYGENSNFLERKVSKDVLINEIFTCAGWRNKMFVKNELMPHKIRITSVNKCRLQDLTDEDCLKEGVNSYKQGNETYYNCEGIYYKRRQGLLKPFKTAKEVFFNLISKLNGYGYWTINPDGYAYEFEIVK